MPLSEADIEAALARAQDPNTGKDFVAGKSVKRIAVAPDGVVVDLVLPYPPGASTRSCGGSSTTPWRRCRVRAASP